jgi:putative spermidine/putrescine transport system ATP-binding protein
VVALVRPEAVVVTPDASGDRVVAVTTFRGATTRLKLLGGDGSELLADVPSHRAGELTRGTRVATTLLERPVLLADAAAADGA